jgi:hypothetical protein
MKTLSVLFFILFFIFSTFGQDITATTDNGVKVILKPDKTWDYVKEVPKAAESSEQKEVTDDPYKFAKQNAEILAKSEFETEPEYEKRISEFYSKSGKTFAVKIDPLSFQYSAEQQAFTIVIYTVSGLDIVQRNYSTYSSAMIRFDFPVSPSEASQIKNNIEFWVYGYPVSYSDYSSGVKFLPAKIVLKDKISGKIYHENNRSNFITKTLKAEVDGEDNSETPSVTTGSPSTRSTPGTDVRVKGYYRRDGTYVRPHTRSAPKRKN